MLPDDRPTSIWRLAPGTPAWARVAEAFIIDQALK